MTFVIDASPTGNSRHVEFPGDPIRVFEGDIVLSESLVALGARVLDSRGRERSSDALQLRRITAGERDMIHADSERIELVPLRHLPRWAAQRKRSPAREEDAEIVGIHQMLKPECVTVELLGSVEIADADGDVGHAGRLHLDLPGFFSSNG